jgi:hypothetical protein
MVETEAKMITRGSAEEEAATDRTDWVAIIGGMGTVTYLSTHTIQSEQVWSLK